MIHDLKILPEYFVEVVRGNKTFEVRKDDRPFNVGDKLILHEVNCGRYTDRNIKVIITYILRNPDYCKEGYCILGFKQPVKRGNWETEDLLPKLWRVCSCCGYTAARNYKKFKYCPNCGAKMDGGADGENN